MDNIRKYPSKSGLSGPTKSSPSRLSVLASNLVKSIKDKLIGKSQCSDQKQSQEEEESDVSHISEVSVSYTDDGFQVSNNNQNDSKTTGTKQQITKTNPSRMSTLASKLVKSVTRISNAKDPRKYPKTPPKSSIQEYIPPKDNNQYQEDSASCLSESGSEGPSVTIQHAADPVITTNKPSQMVNRTKSSQLLGKSKIQSEFPEESSSFPASKHSSLSNENPGDGARTPVPVPIPGLATENMMCDESSTSSHVSMSVSDNDSDKTNKGQGTNTQQQMNFPQTRPKSPRALQGHALNPQPPEVTIEFEDSSNVDSYVSSMSSTSDPLTSHLPVSVITKSSNKPPKQQSRSKSPQQQQQQQQTALLSSDLKDFDSSVLSKHSTTDSRSLFTVTHPGNGVPKGQGQNRIGTKSVSKIPVASKSSTKQTDGSTKPLGNIEETRAKYISEINRLLDSYQNRIKSQLTELPDDVASFLNKQQKPNKSPNEAGSSKISGPSRWTPSTRSITTIRDKQKPSSKPLRNSSPAKPKSSAIPSQPVPEISRPTYLDELTNKELHDRDHQSILVNKTNTTTTTTAANPSLKHPSGFTAGPSPRPQPPIPAENPDIRVRIQIESEKVDLNVCRHCYLKLNRFCDQNFTVDATAFQPFTEIVTKGGGRLSQAPQGPGSGPENSNTQHSNKQMFRLLELHQKSLNDGEVFGEELQGYRSGGPSLKANTDSSSGSSSAQTQSAMDKVSMMTKFKQPESGVVDQDWLKMLIEELSDKRKKLEEAKQQKDKLLGSQRSNLEQRKELISSDILLSKHDSRRFLREVDDNDSPRSSPIQQSQLVSVPTGSGATGVKSSNIDPNGSGYQQMLTDDTAVLSDFVRLLEQRRRQRLQAQQDKQQQRKRGQTQAPNPQQQQQQQTHRTGNKPAKAKANPTNSNNNQTKFKPGGNKGNKKY